MGDVVDLLDRFLEEELDYPLEWDDFISWEHPDRRIEDIRREISNLEKSFTFGTNEQKQSALRAVQRIRDRTALLISRQEKYPQA